jgi:hypothetical protein
MPLRRTLLAALLTLGLTGWSLPGHADDPQAEADVRRVLKAIANMNLTDATTKRRIETVLAEEALGNWQQGRFIQFRSDPEKVQIFDDGLAVARYHRNGTVSQEVYLYLHHDPVWRLVAIRTMARTAMLAERKAELDAIWFRTPEQQAQWENLKLSLATDRELAAWFERHRKELDVLVTAYRQAVTVAPAPQPRAEAPFDPGFLTEDPKPPVAKPLSSEQVAAASDIAAKCQALHVAGVDAVSEEEAPGRDDQAPIRVIVGGILNDAVSVVHAPAGAPAVSAHRNIWVEPLGKDWYLVRSI